MLPQQKHLESWNVKRTVTICGKPSSNNREIEDRLKRRGWATGMRTTSITQALSEIKQSKASVIVIEDSIDLPVQIVLGRLMRTKIGILTPTMVICGEENIKEKSCFSSIGFPVIVENPNHPSEFIESFEFLIQRWSQDHMLPILESRQHLIRGNEHSCIKILSHIGQSKDFQAFMVANPCLALFFRQQNIKVAEKILLGMLEHSKRNVGIIISLVDFYLHAAMPNYSLKLLNMAKKTYNNPKTLLLDFLQAYSLRNEISKTIPILKRMKEENFMPSIANTFLARALLVEGFRREFNIQTSYTNNKDQYLLEWNID